MIEAIAYDSMLENLRDNVNKDGTIGILLARPKSKAGKDIVDTLPYYHNRSGKSINFFLPGYGAYWYGAYPDEVNIVKIDGGQWSFSNSEYVKFIETLEEKSRWKYYGESELLLVEYHNGGIDFSKVLHFHLDAMLRDEAIPSIEIFFEMLFGVTRKDLVYISNSIGLKTLKKITIDSILEALPSFFGEMLKKERHYLVQDYSLR